MITCRDATHLLIDPAPERLSFRERSWLKLHMTVCVYCRRYQRQIGAVRQGLGALAAGDGAGAALRAELVERLRRGAKAGAREPPEARGDGAPNGREPGAG